MSNSKFSLILSVGISLMIITELLMALLPLVVRADSTAILRPIADGGNDSASWINTVGTACNAADCSTEVKESSGSSCTNSDGDTSYVQSPTNGANQTFDLDESSIPDNSTITQIDIKLCYKKGESGSANQFQTRRCVDGSCANFGTDITTGNNYLESTQSHTGLSITKTASTDLEIGAAITGSSGKKMRMSQISAVISYNPPPPPVANASLDTSWIKGGTTGKNLVFTVNNLGTSPTSIRWIKITRPSSNYTPTAGLATGWSATVGSSDVTFTGGSIAVGGSATFTVTVNTNSIDETLTSWGIQVDSTSGGSSPVAASAALSGALNSGIDSTPPTSVLVQSVTASSSSQLIATAATPTDSGSGLASAPYWFDETTGRPGGNGSTAWQSQTSFTDTGLNPSTQYCYRVKARDVVLNESQYSVNVCQTTQAQATSTDTTPPAAVTDLVTFNPSGNSIRLAWTAPGDDVSSGTAASYDMRYSTTNITDSSWGSATQASGEPAPKIAGSAEEFTVGSLNASTTYYFALKTSDGAGNISTLSNVPSGQTTSVIDITPPSISSVSSNQISNNYAVIQWSTDELSDSQVDYGTGLDYGSQTTLDPTLVSSHVVNLIGLNPNTTYNYRVRSKDATRNPSLSTNFTFTTLAQAAPGGVLDTVPPIITDISATSSYATATITWKTNESADSIVEYGLTKEYGSSTLKTGAFVSDHSVSVGGLASDTKYNFRVTSEDLAKNKAISGNFTFTTEKPPPPPAPVISNVSVVSLLPTAAKIIWKTDTPGTSQILFGTKSKELTQATTEFVSLTTDHSINVQDLSPETTYYFVAVSRNSQGASGKSEEKKLQTEKLEIQTVINIVKPLALPAGSPGTQIPKIVAGETVTIVPILATQGDSEPPVVTLIKFSQNPTQNTSPVIKGRANDRKGVIAGISYSTDNGDTWHPVGEITGLGSSLANFSAKIPNLQDGNYPILFRARDNSGNIGKSETKVLVVDVQPPSTGANVMLLGSQSLLPSASGMFSTLSGITQRIVISSAGGAVTVEMVAKKIATQDPKTSQGDTEATSSDITFPLIFSKQANLWFGDIRFEGAGTYQLKIRAIDGTGQVSLRPINLIVVSEAGRVVDDRTKKALDGAKVSVFQFSQEINDFVLWPGEVFNQANPQITDNNGSYHLIVPPGKYYLKIEKDGYKTFYTDIMEFHSHEAINLTIPLAQAITVYLPIPFIKENKIQLPDLPDFFGMKRVGKPPQIGTTLPEPLKALIGKPAPVFSLLDPDGKPIDIRYLRGKKTVITTWATWSPLAQIQVPILDQLQQLDESNVRVLLLTIQESEGVVGTYLRRGGYKIQSVIDPEGKAIELYPILTLPQHFFIDRRGILRDAYVGILDLEGLQKKLQEF